MSFISQLTAGALRHRITIQTRTEIVDSEGVAKEQWVDFLTTMAAYIPVSGKELFAAESIEATNVAVFQIRYRKGIETSMRVISSFGIYSINSVSDVDGRHREIQLQCTSEVQNG